jgi:hypothetical protein
VFGAGISIPPPQLGQNLDPCLLLHCCIHSGHGNRTFGTTYSAEAFSTPARVTILLAQFACARGEISPHYFLATQLAAAYAIVTIAKANNHYGPSF